MGWGIAVQATVSGMEAAARRESPTIGELGESRTLARILPRLSPGDASLLGPGDDAAVVAAADGRYVVTTDLLVHGPDFRLAWSTPFELGWKAAATNLTDVAGFSSTHRTGIIWGNTTCPDGTNSDAHGDTCEGHL